MVSRSDPVAIREALDMALVAAAFDANVSVLFRGAAVALIATGDDPLGQAQSASHPVEQQTREIIHALDSYDVKGVFVCAEALTGQGLNGLPSISAEPLSLRAQQKLIARQDAVLSD